MSSALSTDQYREQIWAELAKVARPDSRFHWDFSSFICDFIGSEKCSDRVLELDALTHRGDRQVFITPDNCLEDLRYKLIQRGIPFVMTTYGIVRGFYRLDPATIPVSDHHYAATLDGFDRYAVAMPLAELQKGNKFSLLVTGGSAVSNNGVRFGKGHGYFDFEWAVLSELGLTDSSSVVADVVHEGGELIEVQRIDTVGRAERQAHTVQADGVVFTAFAQHCECSTTGREEVFGMDFDEVQGGLLCEQRRVMGVPPADAHSGHGRRRGRCRHGGL